MRRHYTAGDQMKGFEPILLLLLTVPTARAHVADMARIPHGLVQGGLALLLPLLLLLLPLRRRDG